MSKNLALWFRILVPFFSNLVPANTITGVMVGCLLENITAARNKFTTANNEWYTANNVIPTIHKIKSTATVKNAQQVIIKLLHHI